MIYQLISEKKRKTLYDFISAIAVLDVARKDELYGTLKQALDDYNTRRFKVKEIDELREHVEKYIPEGKRQGFFDNFQQQKDSNGRTMIDSVGRIAEAVMTFYNKTPLTAFLQIEGFEDSAGSGGKVISILESLDNLDVLKESFSKSYLEDKAQTVEELQKALDHATKRQKAKSKESLVQAQGALTLKEQSLDGGFLNHLMQQLSGLVFYPEKQKKKL